VIPEDGKARLTMVMKKAAFDYSAPKSDPKTNPEALLSGLPRGRPIQTQTGFGDTHDAPVPTSPRHAAREFWILKTPKLGLIVIDRPHV